MELASLGEADAVRLLLAISPQTTAAFRQLSPEALDALGPGQRLDLNRIEMNAIYAKMVGGPKALPKHDADPQLFPNLMADSVAGKMPAAVVMTSEFDYLRIAADELAGLLERNGRLLDYCCHPSCTPCWWVEMDHPRSNAFYRDVAAVFKKWL